MVEGREKWQESYVKSPSCGEYSCSPFAKKKKSKALTTAAETLPAEGLWRLIQMISCAGLRGTQSGALDVCAVVDVRILASCPRSRSLHNIWICGLAWGDGCHRGGRKLLQGPPEATRKPRPSLSLSSRGSQVASSVCFPTKH